MPQTKREASIACLLVINLPVKAERCRYPALRRRPLVIVESNASHDVVLDSSPEAEGVSLGMTLPQALEVCSNATVVQADQRYYSQVDDRIADALERRFGAVERAGIGWAYVRIGGASVAPYGEAHLIATLLHAAPTGFNPKVGVGPGRFVAYALAASAPDGGAAKLPDDPLPFLRNCSVDLLPLARGPVRRLHGSGVHTLGALADMPAGQVQALLGTDAERVQDLARGIDFGPVPSISRAAA